MLNFTQEEIISIIGATTLAGGLIGLLIIEVNKLLIKRIERKNKQNNPVKVEQPIIEQIKEFEEIERYLYKRLEDMYQSFIYKDVLLTLKKYSSLSEATKATYRIEFLKFTEFQFTEAEKSFFKKRYAFEIFKFLILDFFNIKTTKLELFVTHKLEIGEKEFKDHKLFESLFNEISKKELSEIMEALGSSTTDLIESKNTKNN